LKEIFTVSNLKLLLFLLLGAILFAGFALPVFAFEYNPGVTVGQYVKYGNFVGVGLGVEAFNDYDWLKLQVTDISGKSVTLLSTSQYKNGTAIGGNGSIDIWNVESGTDNGVPSTQGPIIAANLKQGDSIPPLNTYSVNSTETRVYLGVSRTVNVLNVTVSTPDYNSTLNYVYDQASGMLLESTTQTTTQAQPQPITTIVSYSIIETNVFGFTSTPSPTVPELPFWTILPAFLFAATLFSIVLKRRSSVKR
jgi:hypothetical protein